MEYGVLDYSAVFLQLPCMFSVNRRTQMASHTRLRFHEVYPNGCKLVVYISWIYVMQMQILGASRSEDGF
ncbi:hypothetical protein C4D60_Mb05t15240 [Musa balbisiana]|uniref:Uncharacterized protein n=1 Tax=Musa balbisiana TaxID=52838 RepID=A0A4S8JWA6_MUSBA|nr:hypothetical protein C4D60_Mb05t15240 [Musa balbisiana]